MKICKFCEAKTVNVALKCASCGSVEFKQLCSNCATVFDSGFCPNCGVKAGYDGRLCPECGARFFSRCCPDCGYSVPTRSSDEGEGYDFPDGTYDTSPIKNGGAWLSFLSSLSPITSGLRTVGNKFVFLLCVVFSIFAFVFGCRFLLKGTMLFTVLGGILLVAACVSLFIGLRKRKGR